MPISRIETNSIAPSQTLTTPIIATTMGVGGATPSGSGSGITFPATQSASTDANTLDDYEEGTWTPTLQNSSGSSTTGLAVYRKIGSLVFISLQIYNKDISAWADTALKLSLPFVVSSNLNDVITVNMPNTVSVATPLTVVLSNGSSLGEVCYRSGAANYSALLRSQISNNTQTSIYLNGCYTTS